jgi:hypothetical protein
MVLGSQQQHRHHQQWQQQRQQRKCCCVELALAAAKLASEGPHASLLLLIWLSQTVQAPWQHWAAHH